MCLNSHICGIHSLARYSRSVFIGVPPPIAPQKWTRGKGRKCSRPVWSLFSSYFGGTIRYGLGVVLVVA